MRKREKLRDLFFYLLLGFFTLAILAHAQSEIKLENVEPGFVDYGSFSITNDGEIKLTGSVAGFEKWGQKTYFYGWILDADSRNVVWHMLDDREIRERLDENDFIDIDKILSLKAGNYEIYFTGGINSANIEIKGFKGLINKIFGKGQREYRRRYRDQLYLKVTGVSGGFSVVDKNYFADALAANSVASSIRTGDNENIKLPFALSKETKLRVYALGEGSRDRVYDYGWIYNASTYEKVWQMTNRRSDFAGGAEKNIMFDDDITLPEGHYIAVYVTDDSHSFDEWNQLPPDDPQFWGITIWAATDADSKNIIAFDKDKIVKPFIEIIKVGDNEFKKQGFTLKKDMEILIHAFGEGYDKRRLSDYGWIVNADNGEKVWHMEKADIQYGGGAQKNRMVHEKIKLNKGNYIVFYSTDGSHSYNRWNAAPPFDPERWGITLWATNKDDKNFITVFDPDDFQSEKVITQITRVRDNHFESKPFTINKTQQVRIIAIGEGSDGRMYDYGWIENADTKTIIWEMTFRKTDHAGGAMKNRRFDGNITLSPGKYKLYYETDGSHSYRRWNATPPPNQEMYGITLMRVE